MSSLRDIRSRLAESPLSRVAALGPRSVVSARHLGRQGRLLTSWLIYSREHTNYTYDLTDNNVHQLIWFVCAVTGQRFEVVKTYVDELVHDSTIRRTYLRAHAQSPRRGMADGQIRFGRRLAWYAIVRARRPSLVVETGTDKGLGSLVLASALLRNQVGMLVTIDSNPAAGYLIGGPYREVTTMLCGDSLTRIRELAGPVDLFLHDSDHSPEHEHAEYTAIEPYLHADSLLLSDNAHATGVLHEWAREHDRRFLYFAEEPVDHWYRGGGVGAVW